MVLHYGFIVKKYYLVLYLPPNKKTTVEQYLWKNYDVTMGKLWYCFENYKTDLLLEKFWAPTVPRDICL